MSHTISESELQVALSALPGWEVKENHLVKIYTFSSFRRAVATIVRIAFEAEESNHHPEIRSAFNTLEIRLCTHDAGYVLTDKDISLATKIEKIIDQDL